jgi:hypothetical protein
VEIALPMRHYWVDGRKYSQRSLASSKDKEEIASLGKTPMYYAVISDLVQHHDERRAWLDRDPN